MRIVFTVTFNVDESGRTAYSRFIVRLRSRLGGKGRVSHDHPVLPPQQARPTDWFEIVLQTNHPHEIRLLFRSDNLYLVAYQMDNSETWLEFSVQHQREHLIPGSTFLELDGCYGSSRGLQSAAGKKRSQIPLGQDCLRDSVNHLATSTDPEERALSLLVLIQMTSEAIRFEDITYFILYVYFPRKGRDRRPNNRLVELEDSWGRISNALLRHDAHPALSIFPLRYVSGEGSTRNTIFLTAEQAISAIGILSFNIKGINEDEDDYEDEAQGRRLVEIFSVKIHGEDLGDYGAVRVTDGLLSQYLYNRDEKTSESVKSGEDIVLTGPDTQVISALDSFTIDVVLNYISHPDEVYGGQIAWNVYDSNNVRGDRDDLPTKEKIVDSNGFSATLVYAVLSNAVQATVEVAMINVDGEDPADVYGTLSARYTHDNFEGIESMLFKVKYGKSVEVRPGELIPLSRSIVAVPFNSNLVIIADLYNRDTFSWDDPIAQGNVSFRARLSGTVQDYVTVDRGQIRVKVTWAP